MKLLVNCDQVFDVLTRGPFPTGDESDAAVEHHLRACHECRQLAEALRPAISLLHEAVASDEALDLPEYQGSLPLLKAPAAVSLPPAVERSLSLGVRQLAPPRRSRRTAPRVRAFWNASRLIAASVLLVALCTLGYGLAIAPTAQPELAQATSSKTLLLSALTQPRQHPLVTLASLPLPPQCFPNRAEYHSLSPYQAARIVEHIGKGNREHALACCTKCHHQAETPSDVQEPRAEDVAAAQRRVAAVKSSCMVCHPS